MENQDKTPDQLCDEGNSLNGKGQKEEAVKVYDQAIAIDPNFGRAYYGKAIVVADLGRETEAVELYKKAISVGHDTAPTYYNMGIDLNSLGRREEAVEAYNQALIKDPQKADAYRNKGNSLMMLGRAAEAVEAYAKALEIKPNLYAVYADIGPLLEDLGRKEEALKYYDTCLASEPKNFRSNYSKGGLLFRDGRYEESLKNFEVALEINQFHPGTCYYMGSSYVALGNPEKGNEFYSKADKMKPELSIQYCNRGQCYYALGRKKEALQDFLKTQELLENDKKTMLLPSYVNAMKSTLKNVLEAEKTASQTEAAIQKLDQQDPAVQNLLSSLRKLQEDKSKVQDKIINRLHSKENADDANELAEIKKQLLEIQASLGIPPEDKPPAKTPGQLCDDGNALNGKGQKEEAVKVYDEAIALDPEFGRAYYGKAIVVADLGREAEAVELYRKAISVGHDTAPTYYNMGIDLNFLGRREEAVEAYDHALLRDPKKADAWRNKGNSLMMLGRSEEAVESYAKAIELKPSLLAVHADIGLLLEDLGRRDEAMSYYDKCIAQDSKNFRSNYCKGCVLHKEGKYEEAMIYLQIALDSNKLHPGACWHLGSAYAALGNEEKAVEFYTKADVMKPELSIQFCNRGQCFYALGRKKEALEDFIKTKQILESDNKTMLVPTYIKFIQNVLDTILESETAADDAEAALKGLDQQEPAVKELVETLRKLQEDKSKLQDKIMSQLHQKENPQLNDNIRDLAEIKKQLTALQNKEC